MGPLKVGKALLIQKYEKLQSIKKGGGFSQLTFAVAAILLVVLLGLFIRKLRSRKRVTSNGYVLTRSESGRERYEHREKAEEILGRRLAEREVVHHINGRRSDNRPQNLCVMDYRDHHRYHEWYDWIVRTYGKYPRRDTQLRKLRENFKGTLLAGFVKKRAG
jgi:hypothetical protein